MTDEKKPIEPAKVVVPPPSDPPLTQPPAPPTSAPAPKNAPSSKTGNVEFERISDDVVRANAVKDGATTHLGSITYQEGVPVTFFPVIHTFVELEQLEAIVKKMKAGNKA